MIGGDDLDVPALSGDAEIERCLLGANHAGRPAIVAIGAGLIVQYAEADGGRLGPGEAWSDGGGRGGGKHGTARRWIGINGFLGRWLSGKNARPPCRLSIRQHRRTVCPGVGVQNAKTARTVWTPSSCQRPRVIYSEMWNFTPVSKIDHARARAGAHPIVNGVSRVLRIAPRLRTG